MKLLVALVLAVLVFSIGGCGLALRSTERVDTFTVAEKAPSTDEKPYRVFTEDGTTYAVKDSFWYWNFRASDRFGGLRVGHTYRCTTAGWRFGPMSMYRNLISCTEVQR